MKALQLAKEASAILNVLRELGYKPNKVPSHPVWIAVTRESLLIIRYYRRGNQWKVFSDGIIDAKNIARQIKTQINNIRLSA